MLRNSFGLNARKSVPTKKKIKSSIKNGGTDHTIKHYRYLARKAKKELEGIKEHFKNKI